MERLVKGLLEVALDAASSVLHHPQADDPSLHPHSPSPPRSPSTDLDRSTWAEVAAGKHGEDNQSWGKAQNSCNTAANHKQEGQRWNSQEDIKWQSGGEGEGRRPARYYHKVPQEQKKHFKASLDQQHFSQSFDSSISTNPNQEELQDISQACDRLWELDLNRLVPGQDYRINCGEGKKVYAKEDAAIDSLFDFVDQKVFLKRTYARFYSLLDNYHADEESDEAFTAEERQEQCAFIEEISRTAPVHYLHKYLAARGIVPHGFEEFKVFLNSVWFSLYERGGTRNSSSAFEHVFVGEVKHSEHQEISGFHNWIQFYVEEANGRVDYQGCIFPKRRGSVPDLETQLLTIQFKWNGVLKRMSTSFIGVSPEFELALYTLCFFAGEEDNWVKVGPYHVNIKCYHLGRKKIGSIFPVVED